MAIKFVDDEPEGSKKPKKGAGPAPSTAPTPEPAEEKPGADELALGDARPEAPKRGRKKALR